MTERLHADDSIEQATTPDATPQDASLGDPTSVGVITPAPDDPTTGHGARPGDTIGGAASGELEKDPDDWVSGDDPMTAAQRSYLNTLARQAGEELPADLNKAEASQHIDRLKQQLDL